MHLLAYLNRIGYRGSVRPDRETLFAVHRAHIESVPYENLDIHLGRRLELSDEFFFDKIVTRRTGGWCYVMNGSLSWALREIGFHVRRVVAGVNRELMGDEMLTNHLAVIVDLDQPYLCDAGLSDALLEPVPLKEGTFAQGGFSMSLARIGDGWRFTNHPAGGAKSFDFSETPVELDAFAKRCDVLQTSPDSNFVKTILCVRRHENRIDRLRDATLMTITPEGQTMRVISSLSDYASVLRELFDLDLKGAEADLWPKAEARHRAFIAQQAAAPAT
jgi:N-hydroxyarylamine O-acetyltransferase